VARKATTRTASSTSCFLTERSFVEMPAKKRATEKRTTASTESPERWFASLASSVCARADSFRRSLRTASAKRYCGSSNGLSGARGFVRGLVASQAAKAGRNSGRKRRRYREARWSTVFAGVDPDPANVDAIREWSTGYQEALHPYSAGGAYVNMVMAEGEDEVRASYRGNYDRLAQIKAKYDPDNLFRVNQNIQPRP
jgi:Berberine and berberine like